MTPRERFVQFVALFAPTELRSNLLEEAFRLDPKMLTAERVDEGGDVVVPALERPMEAAFEFVQYRRFGAPRPDWFPRLEAPTPKLIR